MSTESAAVERYWAAEADLGPLREFREKLAEPGPYRVPRRQAAQIVHDALQCLYRLHGRLQIEPEDPLSREQQQALPPSEQFWLLEPAHRRILEMMCVEIAAAQMTRHVRDVAAGRINGILSAAVPVRAQALERLRGDSFAFVTRPLELAHTPHDLADSSPGAAPGDREGR